MNIKNTERYLTFSLANEQYAIPLLSVREVIEMTEPTPVPQTPAFFRGIINLRGQVISVIDLRVKLQMPKVESNPKTAIIILDRQGMNLGVVVDRVDSVAAFHADDLSDPPEFPSGRHQNLTAVARRDQKMTLILNVDAALGVNEVRETNAAKTQAA